MVSITQEKVLNFLERDWRGVGIDEWNFVTLTADKTTQMEEMEKLPRSIRTKVKKTGEFLGLQEKEEFQMKFGGSTSKSLCDRLGQFWVPSWDMMSGHPLIVGVNSGDRSSNHIQTFREDVGYAFQVCLFALTVFLKEKTKIDSPITFTGLRSFFHDMTTNGHVDAHGGNPRVGTSKRMFVKVDSARTGSRVYFQGFDQTLLDNLDDSAVLVGDYEDNVFRFFHGRNATGKRDTLVHSFLFNAAEEVTVELLKDAVMFSLDFFEHVFSA